MRFGGDAFLRAWLELPRPLRYLRDLKAHAIPAGVAPPTHKSLQSMDSYLLSCIEVSLVINLKSNYIKCKENNSSWTIYNDRTTYLHYKRRIEAEADGDSRWISESLRPWTERSEGSGSSRAHGKASGSWSFNPHPLTPSTYT
ncbi:hypothetical protein CSV74_13360 [Sporosarcina sp. P19]|nr:hypothetical protein CSV74_13360 [Sporosarcina sp. P19]